MTASGFFPQCLANATEGVRLAARIVDTPCNEMNTDTFLEVRGPRESCQGGARVGETLIDPKEVRGYPGLEGDSAYSLGTLPGDAWGCHGQSLAVHPAARGPQASVEGGGRTEPPPQGLSAGPQP